MVLHGLRHDTAGSVAPLSFVSFLNRTVEGRRRTSI